MLGDVTQRVSGCAGPPGGSGRVWTLLTEINPARRRRLEAAGPVVRLQCGKRSADLFPAGNHRGSSGKWLKNGERDTEWHGFQSRVGAGGTHGFQGPSAVSGLQRPNAPTVADFINGRIRLLFTLVFFVVFFIVCSSLSVSNSSINNVIIDTITFPTCVTLIYVFPTHGCCFWVVKCCNLFLFYPKAVVGKLGST